MQGRGGILVEQFGTEGDRDVALVAFSAKDRAKFQTVFEQFVEVFSERSDVLRLIRASVDFPAYIDELVRLIDE